MDIFKISAVLIFVFAHWANASYTWLTDGRTKVTDVECDQQKFKCTYNFTTTRFADSNMNIELFYDVLNGNELRVDVKIQKITTDNTFSEDKYQEEYRNHYIVDEANVQPIRISIRRLSENFKLIYLYRGEYEIKSTKDRVSHFYTCPILFFGEIGVGVSACMDVRIKRRGVVEVNPGKRATYFVLIDFKALEDEDKLTLVERNKGHPRGIYPPYMQF